VVCYVQFNLRKLTKLTDRAVFQGKEVGKSMNHRERMAAVLAGQRPDRVPVGMWYHYSPDFTAEQAAEAHFAFVRRVDLDMIKIMYDADYFLDQKIEKVSDWYKIKPLGTASPFYRKQRDILRSLAKRGEGEYPIWMTMFGAFKLAVMATSDAMVMAHAAEDPKALCAGVSAIADGLCQWADGYLSEGADGIFYSAQFGEVGRFDKETWEGLVKPWDLKVLSVAEETGGKYNVLHLCGEPEYGYKVHIDRFAAYPGAMVNWAVYPNHYEIERGRDLFDRPILGGLDNHGVMARGSEQEVRQAVYELLDRYGTENYALGADCSIESKDCEGRIRMAVEAVKDYCGTGR
jgi:uroporphyrinogen decarboxylase